MMCKHEIIGKPYNSQILGLKNSPLDTLAQVPTKDGGRSVKSLKKRARAKYFTLERLQPLLKIQSPLHKQYMRALYCAHELVQEGGKIITKYCNSRVCHVCNRIRTGKFLNAYEIPMRELGGLEFVTLTVPNCSEKSLPFVVSEMLKNSTNIRRVFRERRHVKISGIQKLEITYNDERKDFHPHLHIVVNKGVGHEMIMEWMKRYPSASIKAQDVRIADENSYRELFKYTTKFKKYTGREDVVMENAQALDIIMRSLHGRRTLQPFGDLKKHQVSEDVDETDAQEYSDIPDTSMSMQVWIWQDHDWVNSDGILLSGYIPSNIQLIEKIE